MNKSDFTTYALQMIIDLIDPETYDGSYNPYTGAGDIHGLVGLLEDVRTIAVNLQDYLRTGMKPCPFCGKRSEPTPDLQYGCSNCGVYAKSISHWNGLVRKEVKPETE